MSWASGWRLAIVGKTMNNMVELSAANRDRWNALANANKEFDDAYSRFSRYPWKFAGL